MNLLADWLMQAALRATLLLSGVFLLWRFLPVSRPALRRNVLLAIAAGVLISPWLSGWWLVGFPQSHEANVLAPPSGTNGFSWTTLTVLFWLGGSSLALIRLALANGAVLRLIRQARPWTGLLALTDLPMLQSSAVSGPCVAGSRHPVLLLPDSAHDWTPAQWEMVLAHETQHLRQHDLRLSWLPRLVRCLYWWHPMAHWLTRQFHAESEVLCDCAVPARTGHHPREYVEFLLSLNSAGLPAHAAGIAMEALLAACRTSNS